jgi:hypothetical protein
MSLNTDAAGRPALGTTIAAAGLSDPHAGLAPLVEAQHLTRHRVAVVRCEMHWERPWRIRAAELAAKVVVFLWAHLRLTRELWRRRDHDLLVVREFLTQIVILVWPLLWPLRRKLFFLVNHNLQEAHRKPLERAILRMLWRTGFNLACLETTLGFVEIGIVPDERRFLVLPHPIAPLAPPRSREPGPPVVGVVGEIRAEKGTAGILDVLAAIGAAGRLDIRPLLGCPDREVRDAWAQRGFLVADTTAPEAYAAALARCDVVVLNYVRERYYYRASGVAADALARRSAVVCPDFPVMRRQLSEPAPVGATFGTPDGLEAAITEALALREGLDEALARHEQARSAQAIAALYDAMVERIKRL